MPSFAVAQSANAAFTLSYVPVVVITGGTSGIGASMAKALAQHLRGRVHVILIGRNKAAAEAIIASLPSTTSQDSTYEFVPCDLTLMKNVHALAKDLNARLPKVNFLVHCAAISGLAGRKETEEGIDKMLALRYYSRFALTYDLLPLLHKAADAGEMASVLTVHGAGLGREVVLDDLGLKKDYTGLNAMRQSTPYNDLMVAGFTERHPQIAFTHIHPGAVKTGNIVFAHPLAKLAMFFLQPLVWLVMINADICAEYMVYALLDAKEGIMNRRNSSADDIGMRSFPETQDAANLLWDHSAKETRVEL